ncbi:innate immunity activator protein [Megalops cyprinoides]|uniref:innate immunity activator protein n=1 Tax=Megalops cyprinoides TaxID=118141 RepID=UPI001864A86D|nr:innate immunity activator protein [Megalops cyprinoides]XP_036389758.1 innate immunity activator protein [Megalops cyprinoides]
MESKEEISDTDSGIILQSGPDSPSSPLKDLTTHTRAMKLKHKSLEDRLELCLLELKKLCIREAELTGHLSSDYPLQPGEKPPRVRRRIGAAFKLNEESIHQEGGDPELLSVEAELALQLQIYEAARRLSLEEHLSKPVRKSRQQQCKREERKVQELREAVLQLRLRQGRTSPHPANASSQRDPGTSDDSSLSDAVVLDEEVESNQSSQLALEAPDLADPQQTTEVPPQGPPPSPRHLPPQTLEGLRPGEKHSQEYERSPIQNSPWKESSLDQPYQKPKKSQSACSSRSSSPAVTPVSTPVDPRFGDAPLPFLMPLRHTHSSSAPTTPELHTRRQYSQSFRLPNSKNFQDPNQTRGRAQLPRRRVTDFTVTAPEYSPRRAAQGTPLYLSSSEDSSSEHSVPSYTSSPCREVPLKMTRPCPPPYGYHLTTHGNGVHNGPLAFTGPSFYKITPHQPTASFYREYMEEAGGYPPEIDMGRLYLGPPPPHSLARYEYRYEEAPSPRQMLRPLPPHTRLARTPSLREYSHHHMRGLPREMVSEELKSWHQRSQFRGPRPRSLDRQGAVRIKSAHGRDSPLSQQHHLYHQIPQRHILQRAPDGTPVQWFVEEDSEIISQV